jgi:hypothetical protein
LSGARTFSVWLARTEDVQTLTARRDVRTARALRDHLPATLAQALAGTIGADRIRALVDVATTSTARIDALAAPAVDVPTVEPRTDPGRPAAGSAGDGGANGAQELEGAGDVEGAGGADGVDGTDGAAPVIDGLTPQVPAGPGVGSLTWEEQLLDWSTQNGPDRFRGLVRYFARHAHPDADERGYTRAKDREHLDISPTLGGYHLSGFLTEEHGQTLTTAIGSVMGAPARGDDRTPGQRRAQALADLARVVLDHGHTGTGASVRPHLSVTVSWTELQALATKNRITNHQSSAPVDATATSAGSTTRVSTTGAADTTGVAGVASVQSPAVFTETGMPVPTSLLRRIACDSQVTRIVFGSDSQILDVGRAQRTVTGQLRRAVIARDRHCVMGQCDQPPARCEVHHAVQHWADGGVTRVTNAALLCWYHHDLVDAQGITMHYDNGWHFTDRDGRPIQGDSPRAVTGT